jgi:hypothetical protein
MISIGPTQTTATHYLPAETKLKNRGKIICMTHFSTTETKTTKVGRTKYSIRITRSLSG